MRAPRSLILLLLLLAAMRGHAQGSPESLIRAGDRYFAQLSYALAEKEYRAAADLGAVNEHVTKRLAECYMKLGDTEGAERWYAVVVKFLNREPRDMFAYAQALKSNGKYDLAEEWMDRYLATRPPEGGPQRSNISGFARKFSSDPDRFSVNHLSVNTPYTDLAAAWCGADHVVFCSSRKEALAIQRRAAWNDQPFLDLYRARRLPDGTLLDVVPLEGGVNGPLHDGPASCSADGGTMYFTRNSAARGRNGITRLGIFRSRRQGTAWGDPDAFLYNNAECSVGHPCLSPDGGRLYFVSDMPGGLGGSDIYVCRDIGGQWGEPENLGPQVNTPHNEATPYLAADGTLFFSSDGHPGLGGMDVFAAAPAAGGGWTAAMNVGAPVNGTKDDLAFVIDPAGKRGYFTSNRPGGAGGDDLYAFVMNKPLEQRFLCTGVVIDDDNGSPVIDVAVELQDMSGQVLAATTTDARGEYAFGVEKDREYRVVARMKGRFDGSQHLSTERIENQQIVARDIHLVPDAGVWLRGAVRYKDRLGFIPGMTVSVVNLNTFHTENVTTGEGGDFSLRLQMNEEYEVLFEKPGHYSRSLPVSTIGIRNGIVDMNAAFDLGFDPVEVGVPVRLKHVKWSGDARLDPIARTELDQLADRLKLNPALVVEVGVHSDARGDAAALAEASDALARTIVDHLVARGVYKDRLVAKGYGASRLLNQCVPGVQCTEEQHSANRRVEYTVTEIRN